MFVIGTAGHIDHGKSLLVERLTGIDPDRLREEKVRGMTIDLGFAWLTLPSGRVVSIVDVPGHERFIKNMLAGAGGVDLALLVVAADDGVMPQTREHLAILDLLGISRCVVALTKRDLVEDEWAALVEHQIVETLEGSTLDGSPIVHCSSTSGLGIDALALALDAAIGDLPPKRDLGRPRLPIDRVFTIEGFGTVVTGTLIDGQLAVGDEIEALPPGRTGRIRGLQSHRDAIERALPGTRTAVNITGIERQALRRGMTLARPGTLRPTDVIDVELRALASATHPLRHNAAVSFHCLADETGAQIRLLDRGELLGGEKGWAQLKLAVPVTVSRGDRFVIRTPNETIAGGVVAEAHARRHRRHDSSILAALEHALSGDPESLIMQALTSRQFASNAKLEDAVATHADVLRATIAQLIAEGRVVGLGLGTAQRFATAQHIGALRDAAERALAEYHARHPLRAGMPRDELRSRLKLAPLDFNEMLALFVEVHVSETMVSLRTFAPALNDDQQAAADGWLAALRTSPSAPASTPPASDVTAFLVDAGKVVDAGGGIYFEAQAFSRMTARIQEHIERQGKVTVAEARDLLDTSRKYAQALLETLDRQRITRRVGDEHVAR